MTIKWYSSVESFKGISNLIIHTKRPPRSREQDPSNVSVKVKKKYNSTPFYTPACITVLNTVGTELAQVFFTTCNWWDWKQLWRKTRQNQWKMKNGSVMARRSVTSTAEHPPNKEEGLTLAEVVQFSIKDWQSKGTVQWNNLKEYPNWASSTPKVLQGPGDRIRAMFLWTQCMWK